MRTAASKSTGMQLGGIGCEARSSKQGRPASTAILQPQHLALAVAKIEPKGPQMHSPNSVGTLVLTPMSRNEAERLVTILLGCYPSPNLQDPEMYVCSVVSLLTGYPLWAGQNAVRTVSRTCKFVPCIAEIVPVLDEEVRIARRVQDMEDTARRQLAARNAPRLEGPPQPPKPPKPSLEELKAKYGPDWGITDPDKRRRELTRDQALGKLRAEFGDVIDTIPDAPMSNWKKAAI